MSVYLPEAEDHQDEHSNLNILEFKTDLSPPAKKEALKNAELTLQTHFGGYGCCLYFVFFFKVVTLLLFSKVFYYPRIAEVYSMYFFIGMLKLLNEVLGIYVYRAKKTAFRQQAFLIGSFLLFLATFIILIIFVVDLFEVLMAKSFCATCQDNHYFMIGLFVTFLIVDGPVYTWILLEARKFQRMLAEREKLQKETDALTFTVKVVEGPVISEKVIV